MKSPLGFLLSPPFGESSECRAFSKGKERVATVVVIEVLVVVVVVVRRHRDCGSRGHGSEGRRLEGL